jgi:hypothetical protein
MMYMCGGINLVVQLASSQYDKLDIGDMQKKGVSVVENLISKMQ